MATMFVKAQPKQARLKVSMYGPPGSGKTFTTLLMAEGLAAVRGGRIAYVDTEHGTDFYAMSVKDRQTHPERFDFDAIYTRSLSEVLAAVRGLDPEVHSIVVLDSISHLWISAIEAYEGKLTSRETIPMQAWGKIKRPYKMLVDYLIGSPLDVFILGRQKNIFGENEEGELKHLGVGMKAEGETQYEPHVSLRMEGVPDRSDTTKTTYLMHVEKDRSGVLSGRTFANPSFATIRPLLPLLGQEQAPSEDSEERVAADAELLAELDEKTKKKEEKSAGIFADLQGKVAVATSVSALGTVAGEVKKLRRYMVEEHLNALRVVYEQRRDQLVNDTAGAI